MHPTTAERHTHSARRSSLRSSCPTAREPWRLSMAMSSRCRTHRCSSRAATSPRRDSRKVPAKVLSVPHVGMPAKRWALAGMEPAAKSSTQETPSSTDAPTHPCSAKTNSPPSPGGATDDSAPSSPDTRVELPAHKSALSGEPLATIRQCNSALTGRCTGSRRWPSRSLPSTRCRSSVCPPDLC